MPRGDPRDLTLIELAADAPSQAVPLLRETLTNTSDFIGPDFTFVGYGDDDSGNFNVRRGATFPIDRVGPASDVGFDTKSGDHEANGRGGTNAMSDRRLGLQVPRRVDTALGGDCQGREHEEAEAGMHPAGKERTGGETRAP